MGKEDAHAHAAHLAQEPSGDSGRPEVPAARAQGLGLWLMVPLGSVLGTGFIPIAPATFASLATLPLVWVLARAPLAYSLTVVAVFFSGVGVATIMEKRWGRDARCITIDEMAGMLVSLFLIPFSVGTALAGFLLFRFFDIVKLPFVRRAERLPAGWGVMTDDVLAGICANLVLQFVLRAVVPAFTRA